ncbi:MAG: carbohydrate ABC transporter substrate-binding protein [Spirochaetales bacterium]|nr:carbohydrate ABC transporter substrate-binding protein [Spirochaetales bacterium]
MKKTLSIMLILAVVLFSIVMTGCEKKEEAQTQKVVTMAGPFTDNDAVKFEESIKAFEAATGIDIQYEGSKEFEASISVRVEGGDPPDIVDFPQPGLLENFVKSGKVIDLSKVLDMNKVKQNYIQSWIDMGTMTGPNGPIVAGIWARVNVKGIVWYNKKAFDQAGYQVPSNWDELKGLMAEIKKDGDTPWAVGIESGAATGWTATDWTEQLMLRTTSLENYDRWVKGELKFDSPEVRTAIQTWADLWFPEGNVYGGRKAVATTFFGDAPKVMFENPPKAWLHNQGNFIVSFFPEGLQAGVDYDFFNLPAVNDTYGAPLLVGGDIYAMFNDRPEVRQVMEFFTSAKSLETWLKSGGALAPHKDVDPAWLTNPVDRRLQQLLIDAKGLRFDGSDLMPGAVGAGTFWKEMTGFVSGSRTLDEAVKSIDASWPE